ncbi:MAG: penicillin-binding protein 2 [Rickettsiales bacterium]|jgi:cell division protein FtsI (penicillin-binding protein 3)|nr:penicillin-binding protein 2 [Rickettsiales bacterium]
MELKNQKIILAAAASFIALGICAGRIFFLSVIAYSPITQKNRGALLENSLARRADIVDRNGKLLATDLKTKDLYLVRELLENEEDAAKQLANVLNLDEKYIYERITKSKSKNILIKRHILPPLEKRLRRLPIAALSFSNSLLRYYLHGNLFANVIGYTDIDRNGVIGMENFYDDYLREGEEPLKLTLDLNVQNILYNKLTEAQEHYRSNFIIGIVSEIKTGNIIAAIALPDYNLNKNDDKMNSFNKITQGLYELGSVFKIFTIANALEHKIVKKDTIMDVSQPIEYETFKIKDGRSVKKKSLTVAEVFSFSSNIGAAKLSESLGKEKQQKFFDSIGLLERINTDFNQTALPLQPRIWKKINLITVAYGYGVAVSPLHIIQAANAVINDGNFISPRFSYNFDKQTRRKVLSKETSDIIKGFFSLTTKSGTAAGNGIDGLDFGGKTGTSEKNIGGNYKKGEHLASFIAAFPMKDPQYSIMISIDRPKGRTEDAGGFAAATVARNVALGAIKFLNVKPIYYSNL